MNNEKNKTQKNKQKSKIVPFQIDDEIFADAHIDQMVKESLIQEADKLEEELNSDPSLIGVGASDDLFQAIVGKLKEQGIWEEDESDKTPQSGDDEMGAESDSAQRDSTERESIAKVKTAVGTDIGQRNSEQVMAGRNVQEPATATAEKAGASRSAQKSGMSGMKKESDALEASEKMEASEVSERMNARKSSEAIETQNILENPVLSEISRRSEALEASESPKKPGVKKASERMEVPGVEKAFEGMEVPGVKKAFEGMEVPSVEKASERMETPGVEKTSERMEVPGTKKASERMEMPGAEKAFGKQEISKILERPEALEASESPEKPDAESMFERMETPGAGASEASEGMNAREVSETSDLSDNILSGVQNLEELYAMLPEEDRRALAMGRELELKQQRKAARRLKRRKALRYGGVAAAVVGIVCGLGMTSEANRRLVQKAWDVMAANFNFHVRTNYTDDENQVRSKSKEEVAAMEAIRENLGVSALSLEVIPAEMEYEYYEIVADTMEAIMIYLYQEKTFSVTIINVNTEGTTYYMLDQEAVLLETITTEQDFEVKIWETNQELGEENQAYIAEINYEDSRYVLNGRLPLEEMEKIVKSAYIL